MRMRLRRRARRQRTHQSGAVGPTYKVQHHRREGRSSGGAGCPSTAHLYEPEDMLPNRHLMRHAVGLDRPRKTLTATLASQATAGGWREGHKPPSPSLTRKGWLVPAGDPWHETALEHETAACIPFLNHYLPDYGPLVP